MGKDGKRGKGSALKAMGSIYGTGAKALFRRRRKEAYSGDAGDRKEELAKLMVRVGSGVASTRIRSRFVGRERRARMRSEASLKASQDVAATMGEMKGLAMKIAQLAPLMAPLSADSEAELSQLQQGAPPVDVDLILGMLQSELGEDVMSHFARFDLEPIAAASIGQVHRAQLVDGREVVCKVQYPGIEQAVLADLEALDQYLQMAALGGGDLEAVVQNAERTLRDEVDYRKEAEHQALFAARYAGHPFVKIAEVVPELSTQRVLTSEFVAGSRFYDVVDRPQPERDRMGEIIFRFAFGSILSGLFTGDPHPGNYLFLDDGRVCFLDFGFVERFDDVEHDVATYLGPLLAAFEGDDAALEAALTRMGLFTSKGRKKAKRLWSEANLWLYGPVLEDRPVALDSPSLFEHMKESVKLTSEFGKTYRSKTLAPWMVMVMRYVPGTTAVLAKLRAEANWHRIMRELALGEPPSTEIGRQWAAHAVR